MIHFNKNLRSSHLLLASMVIERPRQELIHLNEVVKENLKPAIRKPYLFLPWVKSLIRRFIRFVTFQ